MQLGGTMLASSQAEAETAGQKWLAEAARGKTGRAEVADLLLQAWWLQLENKVLTTPLPDEAARRAGWREAVKDRVVEIGWLARQGARAARYQSLTMAELGL